MTSVTSDRRQGLNSSAAIKVPCRAGTTGNIVLTGLQTVDGVILAAGDRVLVKNQTTPSQNGIWVADTGNWTRDLDFDGVYDALQGTIVSVLSGTANANTFWQVSTVGPITFGSTNVTFIPSVAAFSGSAAAVSFLQAGAGALARSIQSKERDIVSVMDFGADPAAAAATNNAAFAAAIALGVSLFIPAIVGGGSFAYSATLNLGNSCLYGAGATKSSLSYSGTGNAIYAGQAPTTPETFIFNTEMRGFNLACTNKTNALTSAIKVENCVHFTIDNVRLEGPYNAAAADPMYAYGLWIINDSFAGQINNLTSLLWKRGVYTQYRTAALTFQGKGGWLHNNMIAYECGGVGDSGNDANVSAIRDMVIEGNYSGGVLINGANTFTIEGNYFEGNGNYDVYVGVTGGQYPEGVKILYNDMTAENIVSPYGAAPYLCKVRVDYAHNTLIVGNNMSVTAAIPLVIIDPDADRTHLYDNRFNSLIATAARITDGGTNTVAHYNDGYRPTELHPCSALLINSWVDQGAPYLVSSYRITDLEEVIFQGSISGGANNTVCMVIPAAARPNARQEFVAGGGVYNNIVVETNGNMTISVKGSGIIDLACIRYWKGT